MAFPKSRLNIGGDDKSQHPHYLVFQKIEKIVRRMTNDDGVPIRTVTSLLTKVPSVATGSDIVQWILKNIPADDINEALHLAHMIACHGYLFPIDGHALTVKNDSTFYRFQTTYFWPSNCWEPENTDYAVYLCKRTMQSKARMELEDYEAENLARLQKMFSRKWEFIFMQAEAQYKVDKKSDRQERQILDSQERAFWDLYRAAPGTVNTTEVAFCKLNRSGRQSAAFLIVKPVPKSMVLPPGLHTANVPSLMDVKVDIKIEPTGYDKIDDKTLPLFGANVTHSAPSCNKINGIQEPCIVSKSPAKIPEPYCERFKEYDPFTTTTELPNPWIYDMTDLWMLDVTGEAASRRIKRWAMGLDELLSDPMGRETFGRFLDKEYSKENLAFWIMVQELRWASCRYVPIFVTQLYSTYFAPTAAFPINVDSKILEITNHNLENSGRYSFDEAAEHIHCLMKNDSYQRFIRSEIYKELLANARKKINTPGRVAALRSVIPFPSSNKQTTLTGS